MELEITKTIDLLKELENFKIGLALSVLFMAVALIAICVNIGYTSAIWERISKRYKEDRIAYLDSKYWSKKDEE